PASQIQESPTEQEWVEISQQWRLEHELTHIATQRLVGEMRLNLFDELIADALGMIKSLKYFSADLFCKGLGINADGSITKEGRVHTYTSKLNSIDKSTACELVIKRAHELEKLLSKGTIKSERIDVLRYLTQQTLDQPLSEARSNSS
ncbi:MAG: hypothetical protein GY914_04000, partial [Prochlorococcus sp.]|nr:hypothetical protein [Prochlorococcus sp.]